MSHSLILGMTESGKTTLAIQLAQAYKRAGLNVIVLDPWQEEEWPADFITDDTALFLQAIKTNLGCAVFIDESGQYTGVYDNDMLWTAIKGRHYGHNMHFVCSKATQVAPVVRDNCQRLFLFRTSLKDCELHAHEWADPRLKQAARLGQLEFIQASRYGAISKGRVIVPIKKE